MKSLVIANIIIYNICLECFLCLLKVFQRHHFSDRMSLYTPQIQKFFGTSPKTRTDSDDNLVITLLTRIQVNALIYVAEAKGHALK